MDPLVSHALRLRPLGRPAPEPARCVLSRQREHHESGISAILEYMIHYILYIVFCILCSIHCGLQSLVRV